MKFPGSKQGRTILKSLASAAAVAAAYLMVFSLVLLLTETSESYRFFTGTFVTMFFWLSSLSILLISFVGWDFEDLAAHSVMLFIVGWIVVVPIMICEYLIVTYSSIAVGACLFGIVLGLQYRKHRAQAPVPKLPLDDLIRIETRPGVKDALIQAKQATDEIEKNIAQLSAKEEEMKNVILSQKTPHQIELTIQKYRQRLHQAKGIDSLSAAKTYAFMITKQKRKLEMTRRIMEAVDKTSSKITVLTHLKEDIIETAYDLPKEADLVGTMQVINMAMDEMHDVNSFMGEITTIEDELKGLSVEIDRAAGESVVDIEALPADVRAEIEREMRSETGRIEQP